jgi:hypothetical protein
VSRMCAVLRMRPARGGGLVTRVTASRRRCRVARVTSVTRSGTRHRRCVVLVPAGAVRPRGCVTRVCRIAGEVLRPGVLSVPFSVGRLVRSERRIAMRHRLVGLCIAHLGAAAGGEHAPAEEEDEKML